MKNMDSFINIICLFKLIINFLRKPVNIDLLKLGGTYETKNN